MTDTTTRLPTVPQMRARILSGHRHALRSARDGVPAVRTGALPSEIRGMRTVLSTLRRWECITADYNLTERGAALLAALEA